MATQTSRTPLISVCIANYNGGDLVLECISSALQQEGPFRLEVIVHDDVSTDGSADRIRDAFPGVVVLAAERNSGFCISNNRMASVATGDYLLLLNNDAVLRPSSLRQLVEFARHGHDDCVLGLPQHHLADDTLVDCGYGTDLFLNPYPLFARDTHEVGVATGACLWIPRATWDAVGGFPAWFESVAEDIYFCLAARMLGHRVFVLASPGFRHSIGANLGGGRVVENSLRTTVRRRALSERNKTFAMLCCYPSWVLAVLLPLHALFLAVEAAFLALSGTGLEKVRRMYGGILGAVWRHRHDIRAQRSRLGSRRRASLAQLFAFTRWWPQKLSMLARYGTPRVN